MSHSPRSAWIETSKTGLSYTYTGSDNTYANPSTTMGMAMIGGNDYRVANEAAVLNWIFSHPAGITNVTYSGDAYTNGSWVATAGLQYLGPNTFWFTVSNRTEPTTSQTWSSYGSATSVSLSSYNTIRFVMDGQLDAVTNQSVFAQFDGVILTLSSPNVPTIKLGAQQSMNFFDFKLTNNTTGEYIKVKTYCPVNSTLTVDCENKKAYLQDGTPVNVTLSTTREAWLDLAVSSNTLQFDDVGTAGVTLNITHRDRIM